MGEQRREETGEWVLAEALGGPPLEGLVRRAQAICDSLVTSASDMPMTL